MSNDQKPKAGEFWFITLPGGDDIVRRVRIEWIDNLRVSFVSSLYGSLCYRLVDVDLVERCEDQDEAPDHTA